MKYLWQTEQKKGRKFSRTPCHNFRRKTLYLQTTGSNMPIEWNTTGYLTTFKLSSKRKTRTWMTTEETTRWHECWDWMRPPWPKSMIEYDDENIGLNPWWNMMKNTYFMHYMKESKTEEQFYPSSYTMWLCQQLPACHSDATENS
jgi:hypothetical protein